MPKPGCVPYDVTEQRWAVPIRVVGSSSPLSLPGSAEHPEKVLQRIQRRNRPIQCQERRLEIQSRRDDQVTNELAYGPAASICGGAVIIIASLISGLAYNLLSPGYGGDLFSLTGAGVLAALLV